MATLKEPFALDRSLNTTEETPRNIADVLAEGLSHITGRTASEVEYDNTDSGLTADNVQDAIDEVNGKVPTLPSVDIQTAVDEFETYNGGLLSSCKVALSPNQDLHGYDSPWVGGAGKNKLPLTVANLKANNTSGTWAGNEYTLHGITVEVLTDDSGNVTGIKAKNGTASANVTILIYENPPFIEGSSYILNGTPATGSDSTYRVQYSNNVNQAYADYGNGATFTEWNHATYTERTVRLTFFSGYSIPSGGLIFYPMIRLATESDPTFEPYSNICPISGHTQVDVGDDGKNSFDVNTYYSITSRITIADNKINFENSNYSPAIYHLDLKQGTYTFSTNVNLVSGSAYCKFRYLDEPSGNLGSISASTSGIQTVTFTVTRDETVYVEFCGASSTSTGSFANCQLELGSTATPYVPYNGYQVTVNLGGTYYSGTLDVVSGVLTVDTVAKTYNGTENWVASNNGYYLNVPLSDAKASALAISNLYKYNATTWTSGCFGITASKTLWVGDTNLLSVISANNLSVVYELATPTSIQLSPTMVKALVGENHLSAPLEGQEITESKYKQMFTFDDVIAYIQSLS